MLGEPGRWSRRVSQSRGALLFCTMARRLRQRRASTPARPYRLSDVFIDLNADLGESFGIHVIGDDAALMPAITSANIAAGFHGGDPTVLRRTIRLAEHSRRRRRRPSVVPGSGGLRPPGNAASQVGSRRCRVVSNCVSGWGCAGPKVSSIRHVKPHGALYNMAAREEGLAEAVVQADGGLQRVARAVRPTRTPRSRRRGAQRACAWSARALPTAPTIATVDWSHAPFPARCWMTIRPRRAQAVRLALRGEVVSLDGATVPMRVGHDLRARRYARRGAPRHAASARRSSPQASTLLAPGRP